MPPLVVPVPQRVLQRVPQPQLVRLQPAAAAAVQHHADACPS